MMITENSSMGGGYAPVLQTKTAGSGTAAATEVTFPLCF